MCFHLETVAADGLVTGPRIKAMMQAGSGGHQQAAHFGAVTLKHTDAFMSLQQEKRQKKSLFGCSIHRKMKTSNRSSSWTLTTRSKALTVRSPEQVYSSPLWICMAFTASWWPSNTPSVGRSSSPWSDDASVKPNTQKYQYEHTNKELFVWYKLKLHLILSFWSPEYLKLNTSVKYALCIFSGWSGYS